MKNWLKTFIALAPDERLSPGEVEAEIEDLPPEVVDQIRLETAAEISETAREIEQWERLTTLEQGQTELSAKLDRLLEGLAIANPTPQPEPIPSQEPEISNQAETPPEDVDDHQEAVVEIPEPPAVVASEPKMTPKHNIW